jgi:uncharacterized protein YbbC (DUF1343 family)
VFFRPALFEPTFQKHAGKGCAGCQIHVTDRRAFEPVAAAVALMEAFRSVDPAQFGWKPPPYEYEYEKMPIDCLAGSPQLRQQIEAGVPARDIARSWEPQVAAFRKTRERFLIY